MRIEWQHNDLPGIIEGDEGLDAFVICGQCGEAITKERQGIALWVPTDGPPADVDIEFRHKGECDDESLGSSEELHTLFGRLLASLGYTGRLIPQGKQEEV